MGWSRSFLFRRVLNTGQPRL